MVHRVVLVVYPGFELLDASGPASVFASANHALAEHGERPFYAVEPVSASGGPVASNSGITVQTRPLSSLARGRIGTLLIVGADAEHVGAALGEPRLRRWLPRLARRSTRFGSVCAGTFVLASLGLIDGRCVTTHWSACAQLAKRYPALAVDPDALFIEDGNIWTSAGVTTGIDMVLAMVAQDFDPGMAGRIAKRLVLYARRPGHQSQFSPLLHVQVKAEDPFAELIDWMKDNLDQPLDVPSLATRAGLSERSFYRKFSAATGQSPARFVESIRVEAAQMLLDKKLSLKVIAARVGLSPPPRLTEVFERRFGMTPRLFRELHAS